MSPEIHWKGFEFLVGEGEDFVLVPATRRLHERTEGFALLVGIEQLVDVSVFHRVTPSDLTCVLTEFGGAGAVVSGSGFIEEASDVEFHGQRPFT
jgi:hypothetical protein